LLADNNLPFLYNCQEFFSTYQMIKIKFFPTQTQAEDMDARSEAFGGGWGRGMPPQEGCVAQGVTEHFQAKWSHLATRKMRPNKQAFSSQVVTLGGSENAIKQTSIFKPSGHTWRLGKCDQTNSYFRAKWLYLAAQKKRSK
jgi:hypothetical protein